MIKFAAKVALASGAVYYTVEQGVWKDSETTSKLYDTLKKDASPYVEKIGEQIPFEMPNLPKSNDVSGMGRVYWNAGVKSTFNFLADLPTHVGVWSAKACESIDSFVNPPHVPASPIANK